MREACWREEALKIRYVDRNGATTRRKIWPLGMVYGDNTLVLLAWCCPREDFRMFRPERIKTAEKLGETFRPRRAALLPKYPEQLHAGREDPTAPRGDRWFKAFSSVLP